MGVIFQSGNVGAPFEIQVSRTPFTNLIDDTADHIGGVEFSLVQYQAPVGLLNAPGVATVRVPTGVVITDEADTLIDATDFGRFLVGFSGRLSGVGQSQVRVLETQAILTWELIIDATVGVS
jgi:hypothetical protein